MKVFYAHPASISPQGIERDTQLLKEALELKYQRFHPGRHGGLITMSTTEEIGKPGNRAWSIGSM